MLKLLWTTWDFGVSAIAVLLTLMLAFIVLPFNPKWSGDVAEEVAGMTETLLK